MLFSSLFTTSVVIASVPMALAYPGMGQQLDKIRNRETLDHEDHKSNELLADLVTLKDSELTSVGKDLKLLLQGETLSPQSSETYSKVPALTSAECKKDPCCVWKYIADDMAKFYKGSAGRCNRWARMAVRLGFHDAGGWSKATADQAGGADGSIILNKNELTWAENNGLQDIGAKMQSWYTNWHDKQGFTAVTMADLIQMSANVATVVCPLGPRVRTYVGRTDSNVANPRLLPDPAQSAEALIKLFEDKTIKSDGLVALVGSHTTSQQLFVDPSRAGDPQDSTPGVWDVLFYSQTTAKNSPKRVLKFQSDVALSQHPQTKGEWAEMSGPEGQSEWNDYYARDYIRLSLLGVKNLNKLTECSKVLPPRISSYRNPDQSNIDKWLNSVNQSPLSKKIAEALNNGDSILSFIINFFMGLIL